MPLLTTRPYQQEMLDLSLRKNVIIALDTGSGKTHIAILRIKHELERESTKLCWFLAPTVALCTQQHAVLTTYLPTSVGIVSGSHYPDQWKDASLWRLVLDTHRVVVSTPQVLLDALRHGYVKLGEDISLLVLDEAHHAVDRHPYNMIMQEFYVGLPKRGVDEEACKPAILGLSASPIYGSGDIEKEFRIIERNLDSSICTPHTHTESLAEHVHRPIFKHAGYFSPDPSNPPFSTNVAVLEGAVASLNIEADPYVIATRKQLAQLAPPPATPPIPYSREYLRTEQKLAKALTTESTFTHKGLRDFLRSSQDILSSIGPWAADWFVYTVVEHARRASNPYSNIMMTWKSAEKRYLQGILNGLTLSPVSYYVDDIVDECSDKVRVLIQSLLDEKEEAEQGDSGEPYSGLVFVQRRDAVLALAELLKHHPATKDAFRIGILLGSSDSTHRHSMMDITRQLVRTQPQQTTLSEFKTGDLNLIISTSVAEEGIDIQACGSVVRWDPPQNMASWVQSRGRARRRRSTFVVMYDVNDEKDGVVGRVERWKMMEDAMRSGWGIQREAQAERRLNELGEDGRYEEGDFDEELKSETTGATMNPHSAVSHLSHFCAIISRSDSLNNRPIYDIDPPDFAIGSSSHSFLRSQSHPYTQPSYAGPWSSTVTLPTSLPIPTRTFCTLPRTYGSKLAAHRHAAFKAYKALWEWGLLNENLLPFTGGLDAGVEEDVKRMLEEVAKREGEVGIGTGIDPWKASPRGDLEEGAEGMRKVWYISEMKIDGLPALRFFTLKPMVRVEKEDGPKLYRPGKETTHVSVLPKMRSFVDVVAEDGENEEHVTIGDGEEVIAKAKAWTRMIFWCFYNARMEWDDTDFSYLLLPSAEESAESKDAMEAMRMWDERREWLMEQRLGKFEVLVEAGDSEANSSPASFVTAEDGVPGVAAGSSTSTSNALSAVTSKLKGKVAKFRSDLAFVLEADAYAERFGFGEDIVMVKKHMSFGRPFKFVGWQWEKLSEEEEDSVREVYRRKTPPKTSIEGDAMDVDMEEEKLEVPYPLLVVESFPPRTNFLHPLPPALPSTAGDGDVDMTGSGPPRTYLIPAKSGIAFYSFEEAEYAFLIPSILRWLGIHLTVHSFRDTHWSANTTVDSPPSTPSSVTLPTNPPSPVEAEETTPSPLASIPLPLLTVALTAPSSGERHNYQRLETLGDAVLKYVVGLQLYAEYPMWHEGYLTRAKDHAVANSRLAKESLRLGVWRWIVRDTMLGKKWLPKYSTPRQVTAPLFASDDSTAPSADAAVEMGDDGALRGEGVAIKVEDMMDTTNSTSSKLGVVGAPPVESKDNAIAASDTGGGSKVVDEGAVGGENKKRAGKGKGKGKAKAKKGRKNQLSTKILADVIESLIGAAYEHGGFDLGYECVKFFDLGIKWQPLATRLTSILSAVRPDSDVGIPIPPQIKDVEAMIGYTFQHKILLIEALTHASYREHVTTISYERLEFLGDGILDMVATDYLYHVPGKEYSPGHMHLRKSAVVNGHFLAYICLGLKRTYEAIMPQPIIDANEGMPSNPWTAHLEFSPAADTQVIYLWQCLLHSNQQVMEDQTNTFTRYEKRKDEIREALEGNESGGVFPWAALTRLQAPKFFSDIVESIIGAVYIDSGGNMDVIKDVLRHIGILPVLERIVERNMDILHPVSRLSMWASRNEREIEYVFEKERGDISCVIMVDGVEEVREKDSYRGKSSQEEVKFMAAEKAIRVFKLRDVGSLSGVGDKKTRKAKAKAKGKRRED